MSSNRRKKFSTQIRVINFNPQRPNIAVAAGGDEIKLVEFTAEEGSDGQSALRHNIGMSTLPNKFMISVAEFNPLDENELAIGTLNGHILVFDIKKEIKQAKYTHIKSNKGNENCKVYSMDWGYGLDQKTAVIYVVTSDGKLNVHSTAENKVLPFNNFCEPSELLLDHCSKISTVSWNFRLHAVALGYTNGAIEIYSNGGETNKLILKQTIKSLGLQVICIKWLKENLIVVFLDGPDVHVIDISSCCTICRLVGHKHRVTSVSVSPASNQIITASCDESSAHVYQFPPDAKPGSKIEPFIILNHNDMRLFAVAIAPFNSNIAVSGGSDGQFKVWKLDEQPKSLIQQSLRSLGCEIMSGQVPSPRTIAKNDENRKMNEMMKRLIANSTYPIVEKAIAHEKAQSKSGAKGSKDVNSILIDEENMLYQ